jgi:HPt (histidine-containing phosphotransfer) domain-containing protein
MVRAFHPSTPFSMCQSCPSELLDRAVIADLEASIGAKGAGDLLCSFFSEAEQRLVALRALTVDRTEPMRLHLHSLHGAAGMFGLARLSALLQKLYRKADALTQEAYAAALDEIASTLTASLAALRALGWPQPSD